jgi:RHS repeat-associated protein
MRLNPSSFRFYLLASIVRLPRLLFCHGLPRKLLCLAIIINLLIWSNTGVIIRNLPVLAATAIGEATDSLRFVPKLYKWLFGSQSTTARQETLSDRLAFVSQVQISPRKFVGYQGQSVFFTTLPTDAAGRTIQGVTYTWESSDPNKVQIDSTGRATFLQPGLVRVTCRAGRVQTSAPVLVRPGRHPHQTDAEWRADQNSLSVNAQPGGGSGTGPGAGLLPSLLDKLLPTAYAQQQFGGYTGADHPYPELATELRNLTGSPRHRVIEPMQPGSVLPESNNFNLAISIVSLGGRGIGANLNLYYNSRVWGRHGSAITFDPIASWPTPGFSLGFGRLVTYDLQCPTSCSGCPSTAKYMLIDSDGTRHYLGSACYQDVVTLQTDDGSHITFVGTGMYGGTLYYPNGTSVSYNRINNRLLPTGIFERNGNYVGIAYRVPTYGENDVLLNPPLTPPTAIDYITDTLGRVIQFQYDTNGNLAAITAPGYGGTSQNPVTRTLAQFDYAGSASFNPTFSGLTIENWPTPLYFLRHIYFPATSTGHLFSYSAYGMIYNVSLRRQMSINGSGVIADGVESASMSVNYPVSPSSLTDAPAFTQRTETAINGPTGVYSYSTTTDTVAQTKTFTVTRPDSSQLLLTRSTDSTLVANGRLVQMEVKSSAGASMAKRVNTYSNDPGGLPQVQSVTAYDDTGTPIKVDFDFDQYGNITNQREYGHQISGAWQVRRRTHITYKTDTSYINAYLRSLATLVEVFDSQVSEIQPIAKSTYIYDDYNAMGGMEMYTGQPLPPGYVELGTIRGNVTGVTQWIDVVANTSITRLRKYDKFGNVIKEQVACCEEKVVTCTQTSCWAMPEEVKRGNSSAEYLTDKATYDFNTGEVKEQKDPNDRTMTYSYDAALRMTNATAPTGAYATASINDGALTSSASVTYDDGGTNKTVTTSTVYDGWGRVIQSVNEHGGQVNTTYDGRGRVISQTNPFPEGGQPGPATTYLYDALGRAKEVTLPDGNKVTTLYEGNKVTVTDQVNRKIKREADGLGRLVKVTEQDANGQLTQDTLYSYDLLDKLTEVNQGNQYRSYKYDALGRLVYEKIPEQTATINGGGGTWTMKYTYTDFGAILTRTDARGVVTTNGYDSLHRLTTITYDTTNAPGVDTTNNVNYTYDTNQSSATTGLLLGVTMTGPLATYTETFSYDSYNRVSSRTWTRDNLSYTTGYQYNAASQTTRITYPVSLRTLNINHDEKGRLSSIADQYRTYLSGLVFNPAGQVTSQGNGNGVTESFTYNNQLQQITQTATVGGNTRMSLTYGYQSAAGQSGTGTTAGNAGQLMAINNNSTIGGTAESAAFTYDLQGRLVTSNQTTNGASTQRRFSYDRWGNRTGIWDATSGGNQIQSIALQQSGSVPTNRVQSVTSGSTVNYTYDAAGNVLSDGVHTYTYDAENRVRTVDWGSANQAAYIYDYASRRVKKFTNGGVTYYVWEGSEVIAEHSSTGGVIANYVYGGGRMISRLASGAVRYYLSDRLSVRMMLDNSGSVVGRQGHLPYGEEIGTSGELDKKRFTSYERDSESGLDYVVNRQYSPSVGRFFQADPYRANGYKVDPQSWNRYSYTQNEPINRVDPIGLDWGGLIGSAMGALKLKGIVNISAGGWESEGGDMHPIDFDDDKEKDDEDTGDDGEGEQIDWGALWELWRNANPCERRTALSYPFAAFKIIELRQQADRWFGEATNNQGQDNSKENAVQHCYFSCLATIHLDFQIAKAFGDAHECNAEGNPENTEGSRHDLHNNGVGRTIGYNQGHDKSDSNCLQQCLASKDIKWLDGNPLPKN